MKKYVTSKKVGSKDSPWRIYKKDMNLYSNTYKDWM